MCMRLGWISWQVHAVSRTALSCVPSHVPLACSLCNGQAEAKIGKKETNIKLCARFHSMTHSKISGLQSFVKVASGMSYTVGWQQNQPAATSSPQRTS